MNPYGYGVSVSVFEVTSDGLQSTALVWETDHSAQALIAEFTTRFGAPTGEVISPFDPTEVINPASLIMLHGDEATP